MAAVTLGVPRSYPNFSLTQISLCGSMSSYLCRLITKDTPPSEIVDYLVPYGSVFKGSSVIPAQFNPADKKLGLALYLRDHPTTRVVRAGFLKKCQEMGYQAVVASTELEDIRSYEDSLATLLDKNVDGVIAWRPSQKVFREFVQHGIPVVLIHNTSRDSTDYNEGARITASPTYIAKSVSDFLSKRLRGQAGILAVTHSRRNAPLESSITRELTQFLSTACPQIQVRHDFDFVGVKQEYTQMAQEFIESNPETLAVFSTAGIACVTWAEAKKAADRNDIIIVGTDYSDESIALTESGDIDAFVAHPIYEESQQGVAVMDAILRGKTYPYYQSLDAPLVTREGLEKYKRLMEEVNNWYA